MTRVRRVAAVVTTLAAAVLATTAQSAHAGPTPEGGTPRAAAVSPGVTHLHLHVAGCDTCRITLQRAVTGNPDVWSSRTKHIGSDHRVSWTVSSRKTHGMSFVLLAPWGGNTGSVPNLVTRYRGAAIDSAVSQAQARAARRADGCWAGTTVDDVTLDFRVARIKARDLGGQPTTIPLAWAPHTLSSWKPASRTYRGTIGNQDAFYCTRPKTTQVTFTVPGCAGCQIGVMNGARRVENTWSAGPKVVHNGSVSFRVPRPLTRGISATVLGPWEGATGYTTMLAWRYAGHRVGDAVTFADARAQTKGSPCWGGTTSKSLTIPLTVRKVTVPGTTGPAAGTIAYADVTQSWLRPLLPAGKGVIGSQEVITCRK